jgi:16S rRNA (adenine1518-N6/adenine1519-N6)-dimethyltransferase
MSDDPTEYMDIVDEHDEVIGRDTRARVHANREIHRGVHVFVANRAGDLLLQRRSTQKRDYPGYWDASVGGQVGAGEGYEEAALRELEEELGCTAPSLRLLAKYDSFSSRQREKRALFAFEAEGPFNYSSAEVAEVRFVSPAAVTRLLEREPFTEGFRRSFAFWMRAHGRARS